jgi:lysophospholipase L1-like esterase
LVMGSWRKNERTLNRRGAAGIPAGVLSLILLVLLAAPAPGFCAAIRIMPLGDSITVGEFSGVDDPNFWVSYRKALRDSLTGAGYDIDFVGTQVSGSAVFLDAQHEGHSGWVADGDAAISIRQNVAGFLAANPPHVVLLHIGTNDIGLGDAAGTVSAEVEAVLDAIDAVDPDIRVVLALIINREATSALRGTTTSYNDLLDAMASNRIQAGAKLVVVDMEPELIYRITPAGDMKDEVHPVASGFQKMANAWRHGLDQILPIADAGPDQQANAGGSVTLDGTRSTDSLGKITSYSWTQTEGIPVTIANSNAAAASFTASDTGRLTFQLVITDDKGLQHRDTCVVNVNAAPVETTPPDTGGGGGGGGGCFITTAAAGEDRWQVSDVMKRLFDRVFPGRRAGDHP